MKLRVTALVFCGRAADSAHQMHFRRFLREDRAGFKIACYVSGGRKYQEIRVYRMYIRDITFRTQCDKESVQMKIKVSKHNIHHRGSP